MKIKMLKRIATGVAIGALSVLGGEPAEQRAARVARREKTAAPRRAGSEARPEASATATETADPAAGAGAAARRALSVNGKNVKIITSDGTVTLRGPVKDDKEKAEIEAKAKRVAGVKKVDNQLEITG